MLTLRIDETRVKPFMGKLFSEDAFDVFETRSVSVVHFVNLNIDAALVSSENKAFAGWPMLKPYIYNFIKGKEKPKNIKIVFSLPRGMLADIAPNAAAAFLNMEYKDGEVRFLTATSQKEFSLSKELDILWDEYVKKFFSSRGIEVEIVE